MHSLHLTIEVAVVYLSLRVLAGGVPGWIYRRGDATLVTLDPRATRRAVMEWGAETLTPHEWVTVLAEYGATEDGAPSWTTSEDPCLCYVPAALRLAGAPAFQGGAELRRRIAARDLALERAAYAAELRGEDPFAAAGLLATA